MYLAERFAFYAAPSWIVGKKQEAIKFSRKWWNLGDDFRTLPISQIVAGIPHFRELALI
jgi:hypothetical protein